MTRKRAKRTLKLRLLALMLAFALVWYSLNPAPRTVIRKKRGDELPDEKKLNAGPQRMPAILPLAFGQLGERVEPLLSPDEPDEEDDDFGWPEFIDG